ncbi:hypothetical protein BGX28_004960 [Mortierella sp. GBA30]|nr:hypothetical protein BGX28_004960 [Mortierella sp. GBA30]
MFLRSTAVLLVALSIILLGILPASAIPAPPDNDIYTLGQEFQSLRKAPSHWDGGVDNSDVDGSNGRKYRLMEELREHLCKPGTLGSDIVATMGLSDEVRPEDMQRMSLGTPENGSPTDFSYLLYKWRGYHDYLWFRIIHRTNAVTKCEWAKDLE